MKRSSLCCSRSARTAASASSPTARSAASPPRAAAPRRAGGAAATSSDFDEAAAAVDRAADHDVLQHRRLADQARRLEGARDAAARARVCGAPCAQRRARRAHAAPASGAVVAADHIQRRGLARAVRPDQSVHLAGPDLEVEPVDRAHAAEASTTPRSTIGSRAAPWFSSSASRAGRGTMARLLSSGLRLAKSSRSAMPPGISQHDDQQQRGVEEGGPRDQRRGELRQHGQDDGAEQRPEDRAAPADQDGDEEQHRQVEGEGVRRDVGLQRGEQPAGDRRPWRR